MDSSGRAYVTGYTVSTNFPTAAPFQPSSGGNYDVFVTKLNASGSALVHSTYLGGSSIDLGNGIAVDSSGRAYVTGYTYSTDFPTWNPFQPGSGGNDDAFIAKISFPATFGDVDGDGQVDLTVWRPGSGTWYTWLSSSLGTYTSTPWGLAGDVPVSGDYDGDGKSDAAVWRPSNGVWYVTTKRYPRNIHCECMGRIFGHPRTGRLRR